MAPWLLVLAMFHPQQAAVPASASVRALDYEFFKARVQPVFLAKREGHARCYVCHRGSGAGTGYLQVLAPGATTWADAQTRMNFESIKRFVQPGEPRHSRLLMRPLHEQSGGDAFHGGGKHWTAQDDPEWQTL